MYSFSEGFRNIEQLLSIANTFLSENKFWTLVSSTDEGELQKLEHILYETLDLVRRTSILLTPYCPGQAGKVLDFLGVPKEEQTMGNINEFKGFYKLNIKDKKGITMKKIEVEALN